MIDARLKWIGVAGKIKLHDGNLTDLSGLIRVVQEVRRQQAACRIWPKGEGVVEGFQRPVESNVPALLISGEVDVATPPSEAERVLAGLPNGRHVIFPFQGHDYANLSCASQLIAAFIDGADARSLDVACVASKVLDWEGTHIGEPEEDISWFCTRVWRFGRNDLEAGGIATREAWISAYEQASGRAIDRARVAAWEVLQNIRWCQITMMQARAHLDGHTNSHELAAIGRRFAETELEVLRLTGVQQAVARAG